MEARGLKQKTRGSFEVGREYFHRDVPYMLVVWASFITGRRVIR